MNHFRKSAALTLLACATSLTLAGCGGGDDSPSSATGTGGSGTSSTTGTGGSGTSSTTGTGGSGTSSTTGTGGSGTSSTTGTGGSGTSSTTGTGGSGTSSTTGTGGSGTSSTTGTGGSGTSSTTGTGSSGTSSTSNGSQSSSTRFAAAGFWGGPLVTIGSDGPPVLIDPDGQQHVAQKIERVETYSGMQANFWDTAAADGSHRGLVILPTGKTWWIALNGGVITNAGYGQTQATGSSVTIEGTFFNSNASGRDGLTGAVVPRSQLNLAPDDNTPSLGSTNWRTTYDVRYDQTAALTQLAGTYTGASSNGSGTFYTLQSTPIDTGLTGAGGAPAPYTPTALNPLSKGSYTVNISGTGVVTLPTDPLGCSGSGTAIPRTDSNVFDLSIRFSGAQCVLGNGVGVQGIAVVENGHLLMLAVPPAGSYPAGYFAYISN